MKNWTIRTQLALGLVGNVAAMIMIGVFAFTRLQAIQSDINRIATDSIPRAALSGNLAASVKNEYLWTLKGVLAQAAAEMPNIDEGSARSNADTATLLADYERTITQSADRKNFEAIQPVREAYLKAREDVFALHRADRRPEAAAAFSRSFEPAYNAHLAAIKTLQEWNVKTGQEVAATADATARAGTQNLIVGVLVVATVGLLVGFFLVRAITETLTRASGELRDTSEQVVSAAGQVSTSAQSLSQGATEQAASLEETSASMEEMASMTRKNAENATQAAALVTDVARQVTRLERGAGRDGGVDGRDQGVERQGGEDHQDDRRDRVPDQHPGAERGGGSGARRRGGDGLRGGGRRGAQPGAALGAGGEGHGGADRGVDRAVAGRQPERSSRWRRRSGRSPRA